MENETDELSSPKTASEAHSRGLPVLGAAGAFNADRAEADIAIDDMTIGDMMRRGYSRDQIIDERLRRLEVRVPWKGAHAFKPDQTLTEHCVTCGLRRDLHPSVYDGTTPLDPSDPNDPRNRSTSQNHRPGYVIDPPPQRYANRERFDKIYECLGHIRRTVEELDHTPILNTEDASYAPTAWAYEQACKALEKSKKEVLRLENEVTMLKTRLRDAVDRANGAR